MARFSYYVRKLNSTNPADLEALVELSKVVKADEAGLTDNSRAMLSNMITDRVVKAIRLSKRGQMEA